MKLFGIWCWKRIYKISWNDGVRNKQILRRVKEDKNILQTVKSGKANRIGNVLRRNCFLNTLLKER
jgi:hypothetical protein